MQLPETLKDEDLIHCWKYDNTTKQSTTEFCLKGCTASWNTIEGKFSNLNTQECYHGPLELCKSEDTCISPIEKVLSPRMLKEDEGLMDFCCCTSNLCNHKSNLRTSHNSVLTFLDDKEDTVSTISSLPLKQWPVTADHYQSVSTALTICSVFGALGILFGLFLIVKRKLYPSLSATSLHVNIKSCLASKNASNTNSSLDITSECKPLTTSNNGSDQVSQRTITEELSDTSHVQVDWTQLFNKGKFGQIYAAFDRNTSKKFCFKISSESHGQSAFTNEVQILRMLSSAKHPNMVKYYGLHTENGRSGILMECCSMGCLRNFLKNHTANNLELCLSFLNDLASGISFLHTYDIAEPYKQAVAHRDICSANLLLRSDFRLVIADFGVSAILDENDANNCSQDAKHLKVEGTPYYIAPEILDLTIDLSNTSSALKQADVYSLGLVMWEIVNHCSSFYDENPSIEVPPHSLPYQHDVKTTSELVNHVCVERKRPKFQFQMQRTQNSEEKTELKLELTTKLVDTIQACWDKDEDGRLTASCVCTRMEKLSQDWQDHKSLKAS